MPLRQTKFFFFKREFCPKFPKLGSIHWEEVLSCLPIHLYIRIFDFATWKKKKKKLHLNARCTSKLYLYGYDCMINLLEGKNQIEILVCQRYLFIPVSPECDPTQYKSLNKSAHQHSRPYSLQTQWGKKKKVSPKVM